jgi:hypothetical protein
MALKRFFFKSLDDSFYDNGVTKDLTVRVPYFNIKSPLLSLCTQSYSSGAFNNLLDPSRTSELAFKTYQFGDVNYNYEGITERSSTYTISYTGAGERTSVFAPFDFALKSQFAYRQNLEVSVSGQKETVRLPLFAGYVTKLK